VEFFPEEGKYHYDGHRLCNVSLHPREAIEKKNRCPVCYRPLTLGVLHRIEELADRPWNYVAENAIPQRHMIQLEEIIADCRGVAPSSKRVQAEYERILAKGGPEFEILLDRTREEISEIADEKIAAAIMNVRDEKVSVTPGFDGEFGKISIFNGNDKRKNTPKTMQMKMFGDE
jgi:PHP family Zn ribbon phosphoesterase